MGHNLEMKLHKIFLIILKIIVSPDSKVISGKIIEIQVPPIPQH